MNTDVYDRLAKVLDTLPNGFPATETGVEIRILKKIFSPEQAELFCNLRLSFETAEEISRRTGRPSEDLEARLMDMVKGGQLFMIRLGKTRYFRMMPWVFGIYEFQLGRFDRELAELCEEYSPTYSKQFFSQKPQLMQTLPIEQTIPLHQEALSYEKVSSIINGGQSFLVNECICKKEQGLLDHPCDRPIHVCLAVAPVPEVFDRSPIGKVITKEEANELIVKSEEAGLVHLTGNVQAGQFYICNCCKCCCGVLKAINKYNIPAPMVINSHYYAQIDPEKCIACGICADERCQVNAIEEGDEVYRIVKGRCIGCGLCAQTCPAEAISLVHKTQEQRETPPVTEDDWYKERARTRGVDYSVFK
jgi:Fe-S-cluster-containing hydrogenase component 2